MRLKNRNQTPPGGFAFYYENISTGQEIRVPTGSGSANGVSQLTGLVDASLRNNGMEVPPDLPLIIEHQICLRQPVPLDVCFSGGIGDDIHHKVMRPLLRSIARGAAKVGLKKVSGAATKIGGCSGCSGTKTFVQGANNLGRAGTLNKGFAGNADYKN